MYLLEAGVHVSNINYAYIIMLITVRITTCTFGPLGDIPVELSLHNVVITLSYFTKFRIPLDSLLKSASIYLL